MFDFYSTWNSNLNCIDVDDVAWSTANWTVANGNIDSHHYFATDCSITSIEETANPERKLLKIVDVLGKKSNSNKNIILFYIYDDGKVEKRITIE